MKRTLPFFLVFLLCTYDFDKTSAQLSTFDQVSDSLLIHGINLVHYEHYEEAMDTFSKLIDRHPDFPVGYFFMASVYQTIMRNYRTKQFEKEFEKYLNLAIEYGKKAIRQDDNNALHYFYLGGAYGYRGLHKVRKRNWFGAFFDGRKGVKNLKAALEKDPELYDVYYGLGTFHYWVGARSRFIRFLFSYKGDRQQGINEIHTARERGRYTGLECQYALLAVYYEEKAFDYALIVNDALYAVFPSNPSCLYMRARIFEQQEKWEEAGLTMQKLLSHVTASKYQSIGYPFECYYRLAYYENRLGHEESALKFCEKALELKDQRNPDVELEGPLEDFKQIKEEAEALFEKLLK